VQFLISALPGFRDLRPPLVAGYLWLVFLWILFKPDIHKRPANEVASAVYDLAKEAVPSGLGPPSVWLHIWSGRFLRLSHP
jgi:hypothetical protein